MTAPHSAFAVRLHDSKVTVAVGSHEIDVFGSALVVWDRIRSAILSAACDMVEHSSPSSNPYYRNAEGLLDGLIDIVVGCSMTVNAMKQGYSELEEPIEADQETMHLIAEWCVTESGKLRAAALEHARTTIDMRSGGQPNF